MNWEEIKTNKKMLPISAKWKVEVFRADGEYELKEVPNVVTDAGMDWLAAYLSTSPGSVMAHVAVGSGTAAGSLGSTELTGEVARKAMATRQSSKNAWITVTTFGGAAESVTSVALGEAGVFNHAVTGGTMFQMINGTLATLGNSDFLLLTIETTIGSRSA